MNRQASARRKEESSEPTPAVFDGYCAKKLPYFGHIALTLVFLGGFASAFFAVSRKRQKSEEPTWRDLILLSLATHKITRIATKDRVTSPFRAPFARLVSDSGSGEVEESARGKGIRRAIGELVTCPFCAAPWVAASLLLFFQNNAPLARTAATIFSVVTGSDFLNRVYYGAKQIGESKTEKK